MCDVILDCTHHVFTTQTAALHHIHSKLICITTDGVSDVLPIYINIGHVCVVCVYVQLYNRSKIKYNNNLLCK